MSYQPPPPPPPGYGAPLPPVPNSGWSIGNALSYGWAKFQANVAQILLAMLVFIVGVGAVSFLASLLATAISGDSLVLSLVSNAITSAVFSIISAIIGAAVIRGSLDVTEGRSFDLGAAFSRLPLGKVIVTALIVGALVFVGTILCILPGIVAAVLTAFAMYFVVDQGREPVEAIKASIDLVKNRPGDAILWLIVSYVVGFAGICACGVGLLVTYPIALLGTAYTYKHLTGQPVAP